MMMTHEISLDGDIVPIGGRTVYMFTKVAETKFIRSVGTCFMKM